MTTAAIVPIVSMPDATVANTALIESWTLSLHEKRPRTVVHYIDEVWRFAGWLSDHHRPTAAPGDLLAVGRQDVERGSPRPAGRRAGPGDYAEPLGGAAQPVRVGARRRRGRQEPARTGRGRQGQPARP